MLINFIDDSINTRYDEVTWSYLAYQLFQHLTPALLGVNLYKLARGTLIVALDPLRSSGWIEWCPRHLYIIIIIVPPPFRVYMFVTDGWSTAFRAENLRINSKVLLDNIGWVILAEIRYLHFLIYLSASPLSCAVIILILFRHAQRFVESYSWKADEFQYLFTNFNSSQY